MFYWQALFLVRRCTTWFLKGIQKILLFNVILVISKGQNTLLSEDMLFVLFCFCFATICLLRGVYLRRECVRWVAPCPYVLCPCRLMGPPMCWSWKRKHRPLLAPVPCADASDRHPRGHSPLVWAPAHNPLGLSRGWAVSVVKGSLFIAGSEFSSHTWIPDFYLYPPVNPDYQPTLGQIAEAAASQSRLWQYEPVTARVGPLQWRPGERDLVLRRALDHAEDLRHVSAGLAINLIWFRSRGRQKFPVTKSDLAEIFPSGHLVK